MCVILLVSLVTVILYQPAVELFNEPEFAFNQNDLEFIDFEGYSLSYMLFRNFPWKHFIVVALIAACVCLLILWKRSKEYRVIIFDESQKDPWEDLLAYSFPKQKSVSYEEGWQMATFPYLFCSS